MKIKHIPHALFYGASMGLLIWAWATLFGTPNIAHHHLTDYITLIAWWVAIAYWAGMGRGEDLATR